MMSVFLAPYYLSLFWGCRFGKNSTFTNSQKDKTKAMLCELLDLPFSMKWEDETNLLLFSWGKRLENVVINNVTACGMTAVLPLIVHKVCNESLVSTY